jgi:hypothetical protein
LDNAQVTIQGAADPVTVASGLSNSIAGSGGLSVSVAAGAIVQLAGASAYTVTAAGANVALAAGAAAKFTGSSDGIVLYAGAQLNLLSGQGDWVTPLMNNSFTDGGAGTLVRIGGAVGTLHIANFAADATGAVDLLNGVGGYASAAAASAAVTSDGAGGALLSLGAGSAIDFAGVAPSALGAAHFKIG